MYTQGNQGERETGVHKTEFKIYRMKPLRRGGFKIKPGVIALWEESLVPLKLNN